MTKKERKTITKKQSPSVLATPNSKCICFEVNLMALLKLQEIVLNPRISSMVDISSMVVYK